jgi:hypothetical protein
MLTAPRNAEHDRVARHGAWLLGAGAIGLLATCIFYVLAGPEAALPGGATTPAVAIAATPAATGMMRCAGLIGMPSDVLLAVGGLLIATQEHRRGAPVALAGWLVLAIASALFIAVDAMVAMVLPVAAAQAGGEAAYAGLRALFDVLFTFGAWAAAGGALAVAWRPDGVLFRWPMAVWGMRAAGVVGLLASTAHLLGGPGAPLIGPGIAMLALAVLGAALSYVIEPGGGSAARGTSARSV